MTNFAQPRDGSMVAWRRYLLLHAVVVCALTAGCRVYPEPNRKTIDELYFEALDASKRTPENTLGLNPSVNPKPSDTQNYYLEPVQGVPIEDAPAPPEDPAQLPPRDLPPADLDSTFLPPVPILPQSKTTPKDRGALKPQTTLLTGRSPTKVRRVSHGIGSSANTAVSENFEETDIRQALQVLASQAGVTLIVDDQVSGSVTALIEDLPFEAALRKITMPLGLVFREHVKGEYIVASPDPESPLFSLVSERLEYHPLNVSPDELMKLIPQREAKFVTVVDKRNLMLIEAPKEIAEPILARFKQSDNPIPQVELEAIICVIAPDRGFKSGLDWNHAVTLNGSEVLKVGMAGLAFSGQGSPNGANNAFSNFAVTAAFVKLLAQEGYLSIRAAPRVTARDGEPAKIAITRQSYFSTQPTSATTSFFNYQIQQVEAGITLEITPIIRGDNITVQISKAEVSEDIRTTDVNAVVANNPYPLINRRSVSTTVSVKDSETIVIGGLVQRQTVDRISKIPVLGAIPYAGRIFQTVEQLEQDAEVVIFISPRIVNSGPGCPPETFQPVIEPDLPPESGQ
ncbi:MAG: type II and III secretion system protein [Fuerstia sp.]|nr:type II and III secretion system protein [Fuerstiella sp.]